MPETKVELTLYVRRESEACDRAREAVQSALAAFEIGAVTVRIVDIDRAKEEGTKGERITTAPVVKLQRGQAEPSWLLSFDTETLVRRLRWLGLQPRRPGGETEPPRPSLRPPKGRA
jgi:hypothetical protein